VKHSIATESYIEGVVEYKQYKDALGLTAPEARHHPDTLEVFEELTENVATNDGLRFIYTSALRSRGENRQNAIAAVREVESEIIILLHDLDIIGNTAYRNTLAKLEDNAEIKKRAERFIQLFKPVFPVSELPKARKRKLSRKAPETSDDSQPTLTDLEPSTPVHDRFGDAAYNSPATRQTNPRISCCVLVNDQGFMRIYIPAATETTAAIPVTTKIDLDWFFIT
jgi:hypothetical protein